VTKQAAVFVLILVLIAPAVVVADATRVYSSCDLEASFEYPSEWGNPVITDHRTDSHKAYLLGGAGLDWTLRFNHLAHRPFYVALRVGEHTSGSETRVVGYEGGRDTTSFADLRSRVLREAVFEIDGNPALVEESYFDPGGTAQQIMTWFCGDRVYELTIQAQVGKFENVRYGKTLGITRLLELNPDDSRLIEFVDSVSRFLKSFQCEETVK